MMTFKEMETTWKEERVLLDEKLQLNTLQLETTITQKRWRHLKGVVRYHQFGIATAFVYAGLLLYWAVMKVGYDNWPSSIPLYLGILAFLANGTLVPLKAPPLKNLEQFTISELHQRIIRFRKAAMWRFPIDLLTVGFALFGFFLSCLSFLYGIEWWHELSAIPLRLAFTYLGLFAFIVIACYATLKSQLGKIAKLEVELRDFSDQELV
ncbi:MAG: hypothetical protein AAGF89_02575 [Bacteroidota bacterium]